MNIQRRGFLSFFGIGGIAALGLSKEVLRNLSKIETAAPGLQGTVSAHLDERGKICIVSSGSGYTELSTITIKAA